MSHKGKGCHFEEYRVDIATAAATFCSYETQKTRCRVATELLKSFRAHRPASTDTEECSNAHAFKWLREGGEHPLQEQAIAIFGGSKVCTFEREEMTPLRLNTSIVHLRAARCVFRSHQNIVACETELTTG